MSGWAFILLAYHMVGYFVALPYYLGLTLSMSRVTRSDQDQRREKKMKDSTRIQLMNDIENWLSATDGVETTTDGQSIRALMDSVSNNLEMWDTFWPSIRACGANLEASGYVGFPAAKGKTSSLPDHVDSAITVLINGTSRARIAAWETDPAFRYSIRKSGKSGGGFYATPQELNDAENKKLRKLCVDAYKAAQSGDNSALYHAVVEGDTLTLIHNGGSQ